MMMMIMMNFLSHMWVSIGVHGFCFGEEQYPSKVTLQKNAETTFTLLWLARKTIPSSSNMWYQYKNIYLFWSMQHFLVVTCYLLTVVCNLNYIYSQVYVYCIYIHKNWSDINHRCIWPQARWRWRPLWEAGRKQRTLEAKIKTTVKIGSLFFQMCL